MAKRPRLTKIFDLDLIPALLARRRIAARLCMGQGVVEMARLEGVPVARMIEITDHPVMVRLAKTWMAYLRRIQDDRDLAELEGHALRLAEHELETGNGPCGNLLSKLWAFCGSPARGLMEMAARRFCALADRCVPRRRPEPSPYAELEPAEPSRPEPTPAELAAKLQAKERLQLAKRHGMAGGLDLRYVARSWGRGVAESLFRKLANIIENRQDILLLDPMRFPVTRPDPGPFYQPRFGRATIWAEPGATEFRFTPVGAPGAYRGAFQVLPTGRVLRSSTDLALRKVELAFEPWAGNLDKMGELTRRARAWLREQQRQAKAAAKAAPRARASPA